MRLFHSRRDVEAFGPDEIVNLVWRYEVSEDDGDSWRPENELEPRNPAALRRGCWVAPPLN
jgi:hypothetical protein